MKKINYVKCENCSFTITQAWYDPHIDLCKKCNNTREVIDPKDILCNMCGGCMCPIGTINEQNPHGLHDTVVMGGYDSTDLFDLVEYKFSICEKCLRVLFNQFKIKPSVFDDSVGITYDFEKDQAEYEYRAWVKDGGYHQAYLDKKCNLVKNCNNKAIYTHLISGEFTEDSSCEEHSILNKAFNLKLVPFISEKLKAFI